MLAAGWLMVWAAAARRMDPRSATLRRRSSEIRSGTGSARGISRPYSLVAFCGLPDRPRGLDTGSRDHATDRRTACRLVRAGTGAPPAHAAGPPRTGRLLRAGPGGRRSGPFRPCGRCPRVRRGGWGPLRWCDPRARTPARTHREQPHRPAGVHRGPRHGALLPPGRGHRNELAAGDARHPGRGPPRRGGDRSPPPHRPGPPHPHRGGHRHLRGVGHRRHRRGHRGPRSGRVLRHRHDLHLQRAGRPHLPLHRPDAPVHAPRSDCGRGRP